MKTWHLSYEGFDPEEEGLREALCTVGNGYFATRGALPEMSADGEVHYPGTYVAGVYNRLTSEISARWVENESLVNVPNWLPVRFRVTIDGETGPWIDRTTAELIEHQLELDIQRGVLLRRSRFRDPAGRVLCVTQRRFVSMADAHIAALETVLVPENFSGTITVESALDGTVENTGVARYRSLPSKHLEPEFAVVGATGTLHLTARTNQSHIRVAESARMHWRLNGAEVAPDHVPQERDGWVGIQQSLDVAEGDEVIVEKVVTLYTSRDAAIAEPATDGAVLLEGAPHFDALLRAHVVAWRQLWNRTDVELSAPEDIGRILHLHMFHTLVTVSPHSALRDVGVPARGLHGEAYRGHIFWDEMFIFPFLSMRLPELTRSLLLYRYRRLGQARRQAVEAGYAGAMYPWQSGANGREETQTMHLNPKSGRWLPDASHLQRHVNAAVAYNIWQYYQATGDEEFLRFYGAEMIFEIARFWSSIATYDHVDDRYEIRGVMGPDEYHERYPGRKKPGLDNNAYTNVMAVWCLIRALDLLQVLPPGAVASLRERLLISPEELDRWEEITRKMKVCFHDGGNGDGVVLSQFEGYEALEEFDWDGYRERYGDISRLDRILEAEGDSTNRYKLAKQADVVMLFYLLSGDELAELFDRLDYDWDEKAMLRNIAYYEARTSHGSTLSRVVHAWIYARTHREQSWEDFLTALHSDVNDVQGGTTPEGIHMGAMAGTIDLVQRCYTGLELRDDSLRIDPAIPRDLRQLSMDLRYRDHAVHLVLTAENAHIRLGRGPGKPITLRVRGHEHVLAAGDTLDVPMTPAEARVDGIV